MLSRFIIAAWVIGAFSTGWLKNSFGDAIGCLFAAIFLLFACGLALITKRERGIWMLQAAFGAFLFVAGVFAAINYDDRVPQSTKRDVENGTREAILTVWLCFLSVRLLASAAVHNFQFFR